ncbi:37S ribosomal protein S9, mitochondrial [Coemansia sp. RSA 552]|nr:37S ribosomal protein S9, mitochondrial [Coemansia sp. RSA 552]
MFARGGSQRALALAKATRPGLRQLSQGGVAEQSPSTADSPFDTLEIRPVERPDSVAYFMKKPRFNDLLAAFAGLIQLHQPLESVPSVAQKGGGNWHQRRAVERKMKVKITPTEYRLLVSRLNQAENVYIGDVKQKRVMDRYLNQFRKGYSHTEIVRPSRNAQLPKPVTRVEAVDRTRAGRRQVFLARQEFGAYRKIRRLRTLIRSQEKKLPKLPKPVIRKAKLELASTKAKLDKARLAAEKATLVREKYDAELQTKGIVTSITNLKPTAASAKASGDKPAETKPAEINLAEANLAETNLAETMPAETMPATKSTVGRKKPRLSKRPVQHGLGKRKTARASVVLSPVPKAVEPPSPRPTPNQARIGSMAYQMNGLLLALNRASIDAGLSPVPDAQLHTLTKSDPSKETKSPRPMNIGRVLVNGRSLADYFPNMTDRESVIFPFQVASCLGKYNVFLKVEGSGRTGQAEACQYAIADALRRSERTKGGFLFRAGLLIPDPRQVERKKTGKPKARKSYTWVKR